MNFTMVLATARSGSTMLAADIQQIGHLGHPKEHFIQLFRSEPPATEAEALARLTDVGLDAEGSSACGVKIMVAYAPKVAQILLGETYEPAQAILKIVAWADRTFDAVNIVALRRNSLFEQALSHAAAVESGIWHSKGKMKPGDNRRIEFANDDERHFHILQKVTQLVKQNAALDVATAALGDRCLRLVYEEIAADPGRCETLLRAHATRAGLTPGGGTIERQLQKIVTPEEVEAKRNSFRRYMDRNLFATDV